MLYFARLRRSYDNTLMFSSKSANVIDKDIFSKDVLHLYADGVGSLNTIIYNNTKDEDNRFNENVYNNIEEEPSLNKICIRLNTI